MQPWKPLLAASLVVLAAAPVAAGQSGTEECIYDQVPAFEVLEGTVYLRSTYIEIPGQTDADFWLEDNGLPGLQTGDTLCNGIVIFADYPLIFSLATDGGSSLDLAAGQL